jgi:2-dehydropantoate 2-reductase
MAKAEFAILGAGALGSILGAHLAKAGHDVVLLARGRRAQQITADGLAIEGLVELQTRVPVLNDPGQFGGAETLIVATKAISTAVSLEPLRHADIGSALSIQNGLLKDEVLGAAFGRGKVLGALANFSGELLTSGTVLFTRNNGLTVGELDGAVSDRVRRIVDALERSGVRATATDGIVAAEWTKFAAWVGLMALSVTTRRNTWEYLCHPGAARVLVRLVREVGLLATARGVRLVGAPVLPIPQLCEVSEDQAVEIVIAVGRNFQVSAPTHRVSALQDVEAGRPLELDETLGHAVGMARRLQVPTPLLEDFYGLLSVVGGAS